MAEVPSDPVPAALEQLSVAECWSLLGEHCVGRLAVITADGLPFVVPVNYGTDGEAVVLRTDYGTKFDAMLRHPVAFQVDDIDPQERTGWTVLVQGIAHEVTPDEARHLTVEPWAGPRERWVRVVPRNVSGRRLTRSTNPPA